jgi:hypothetical protein
LYGNGFVEEKFSESLSIETKIPLREAICGDFNFQLGHFEQIFSSNPHLRSMARQNFRESTSAGVQAHRQNP